jgi:hypothetical protein
MASDLPPFSKFDSKFHFNMQAFIYINILCSSMFVYWILFIID